jgi:type VI secretion system protein ImpA
MATDPLLPIDELLSPLNGETAAGDTVPFSIRQQLEEHRKEINPKDFAADDPLRPTDLKVADWSAIIDLSKKTLQETSKDLLVAARMTEALVKKHGFAGLRDGLQLLRRLVEDCWDRLHPSIDDGDLEVRAGPFNWLDDPERGARFPMTVRLTPLVFLNGEGYGWQHWKQMQENRGDIKTEDFERAVLSMSREQCQNIADDLDAASAELTQLTDALNSRLGEFAPSLLQMERAVSECAGLARQILERKGPAQEAEVGQEAVADETATAEAGENGAAAAAAAPAERSRRPRTRADIYQQLTEAARLLQQMEPHSPIPYLIQKCVELGNLPFPQLMKALIRNDDVIFEMNRELGIKQEPAPDTED